MPPKKNKKPSRNGYWQFVLEVRDKQPNKHLNSQELQDYAHRKWTAMSKEERRPYEERAVLARDGFSTAKYTTDGLEIEAVEKKEKDSVNKMQDMKNEITRILKAASFDLTLPDKIFLIIHINHLTHYPAQDKYFICEIAIAAVSLKKGIENIFYRLVKPGKLPLGFYGPALSHSKETHQMIELVQDEPYEDNTPEVFADMISFMRKYGSKNKLPILYSTEKTLEMTIKVIENFQYEFQFAEEIKVYNFQYFFFALRNTVAGKIVWPTETFSYSELEKDVFCYTPNISCEYHEASDLSVYCSKAIITRYAYTVCDHCCADLNIQLVPGSHVPEKSKITSESSRRSSAAPSVCSTDDYRQRVRGDSLSSGGYDEDYPPLGSSKSTASVVSFSSMRRPQAPKAAARIEQSFKAYSMNESKRDYTDLKFPERGCKKREDKN